MSFGHAGEEVKEAVVSYIVWSFVCLILGVLPYGIGASVPLIVVLLAVKDLEDASKKTTARSVTVGAFVTGIIASALNDQPTGILYLAVAVIGFITSIP